MQGQHTDQLLLGGVEHEQREHQLELQLAFGFPLHLIHEASVCS